MQRILLMATLVACIWAAAVTRYDMEVIRLRPSMATTQGRVLVAGGDTQFFGPSSSVSVWSIAQRQFLTPANLTQIRTNLVGLSFPNTVLFIDTNTSEVEKYDPSTNRFTKIVIPGLSAPFAAAAVNNKAVFVVKGHSGIVYNVDTATAIPWSLCTTMCEERNEGIATAVVQSRVFFAGGGAAGSRRVNIYNDQTGNFATFSGALSIPRSYLKSAVTSNRVVFAGGPLVYQNAAACASQSVLDVYNFQSGVWTTNTLPNQRYNFGMASANGDYVLFAEGTPCDGTSYNLTQVYNANSNTFGSPLQSRGTGSPVGFTVSSHAVFVGGGLNQYQPLVEIFSSNRRVESLEGGTTSDFAVLSANGQGYLAGGVAPRPTSTFLVINV